MREFIQKHRKTVISYGGVTLVLLAVALLYFCWDKGDVPQTAAPSVTESDYYLQSVSGSDINDVNIEDMDIVRVRVTELLQIVDSSDSMGGESLIQRTQIFMVDILTGEHKGENAVMTLDLTDLTGTGQGVIEAKVGDRLLGFFVEDESNHTLVGTCTGFQRDLPLMWLGIGFVLLLTLFFGREGFKSFAALAVTCVMLIFVMIPLVYHGMDPVAAVAVFGFATIVVTLLMVYGPSASSVAAGCGAIGGVLAAALIAYLMKEILWITGTAEQDSVSLLYTDNGAKLDVSAIAFAAIVIGSLGGTIDVSVSISSSLEELKEKMGRNITGWELARSGMTVGRSIMGASLNTMILAYVGSSFQLLMLFSAYNMKAVDILNYETIALELLRSLAGCFGLLMTVPLTSVAAAMFHSGGNMGQFCLAKDGTLGRLLSARERAANFWRKSVKEADESAHRREEEEQPVNLFERSREHFSEAEQDSRGRGGDIFDEIELPVDGGKDRED